MHRTLLTLLATLAPFQAAGAQTVAVTLAPTQDNSIYGFGTSLSNGAGSRLFTGNDLASGTRRGLLMFDVASAVPAGATIVSARLELTISITRSADLPVDLHRVTADWGEGGSIAPSGQGGGTPAMPGDATWTDRFFPSTTWQSPGGDFVATPSASTVVGNFGTFTWSSAQLAADVQGWLDQPATAFGWILLTQETGPQTARAFHSREATNAADRPRLVIDYTPVASVQSIGNGCAAGGPAPLAIAATGLPRVPNPAFAITITGGPVNGLRLIDYFGRLLPSPLPIGQGCFLLGDVGVLFAGVSTTGTSPLPVPNDPNLLGAQLVVQGFSVDSATLTIAASNALVLTVGT